MKYVLMGISSYFGNMFSAAAGSLVLGFPPTLPTQMTIPTDNVAEEQLRRPSHWDAP
jgi:Mg2+-importing ATPase